MRRPTAQLLFADYLLDIIATHPEAETIHLVMDNLSSYRRKAVVARLGEMIGNWSRNRRTGITRLNMGSD